MTTYNEPYWTNVTDGQVEQTDEDGTEVVVVVVAALILLLEEEEEEAICLLKVEELP